jgi:hypothetical protein
MSKFYLSLFHGRTHPDKELDDWGLEGPILGPFDQINVTYMAGVRLFFDNNGDEEEYEVRIVEDMFFYDGIYYGDWAVLTDAKVMGAKLTKPKESKFDPDSPECLAIRAKHRLVPNLND